MLDELFRSRHRDAVHIFLVLVLGDVTSLGETLPASKDGVNLGASISPMYMPYIAVWGMGTEISPVLIHYCPSTVRASWLVPVPVESSLIDTTAVLLLLVLD